MPEIKSMIELTVQLINNKTDGFFDLETQHVFLHILVNNSGCAANPATTMTHRQQEWANKHGHALDGMIGEFCTDGRFEAFRSYSIILFDYFLKNILNLHYEKSWNCQLW
jgi:hypothetical protein